MTTLLLDRYRPLETFTEGGFGDVIVAFDERLKRRVAIKVLEIEDDASHLLALEEVRTAALLAHPKIVAMHDFVVEDGQAYLVMEYIDGITLADIESDDLSDEVIAAIVGSIGEGLSYAHKNGVLHLDIKPANILIDREGNVKIADFGVSKLSSKHGHESATGGTLGYMPYEQITGMQPAAQTDLWAFGAVVYELLSDEYPYEEEYLQARAVDRRSDSLDVMRSVMEAGQPELIQVGSPEINDLLATTLAREPERRPPSVSAFRTSLLADLPAPASGRSQLKAIVEDALYEDEPESDPSPQPHTPVSATKLRFLGFMLGIAGGAWAFGCVFFAVTYLPSILRYEVGTNIWIYIGGFILVTLLGLGLTFGLSAHLRKKSKR